MLGTLAGIDEPQVRLKDFLGPNTKSMFNNIGCILCKVEVWVPYLLLQGVSMVISTDRKGVLSTTKHIEQVCVTVLLKGNVANTRNFFAIYECISSVTSAF